MASELPSPTWHPALMPNSIDAATAAIHDSDAPTEPATGSVPESTQEPTASRGAPNPENGQDPADAWFANDGNDEDGDAWLASDDVEPQTEAAPAAPVAAPEHAEVTQDGDDAWLTNDDDHGGDAWLVSDDAKPHDAADQEADAAPPPAEPAWVPAAKHSSSMSFARTVSHDINFNDDDGTEFSPTRSEVDTFSFMPLSDRTNSFPVVPPMTTSNEPNDQPLPATQALDLLEETEREAEFDEQQYLAGNTTEEPDPLDKADSGRSKHAASRSIGGEIQEPDATEARYEEGLPLISQVEGGHDEPQGLGQRAFTDPFADDDGNDDGFFSQPQTADTQPDDHADKIHPIERKSTMQVLGSLDHEPLSRQSTLEETLEEHQETTGEQTGDEVQPAAEDLASKWQEAFASDDDEGDFLLEDSATETKDIDATAFLGSDDEGFLDDENDDVAPDTRPVPVAISQSLASNPYAPAAVPPQPTPAAYTPMAAAPSQGFPYQQAAPTPFGQPAPPRPELTKAQSFADKAKGGYASPYDLPTDLVNTTIKPRKRASMQQLPKELPPAPPRSASMTSPNRPPSAGPPSAAAAPPGPPLNQKASAPALRSQSGFFEDLPVQAKPRPGSRQSNRAPSPSTYTPTGQQSAPFLPSASSAPPPTGAPLPQQSPHTTGITNLVAPERVSPYAALQSAPPMPPPSTGATRYSPAPAHQPNSQSAPPPAAASRYSPAPAPRAGGSYSPSGPATPSQGAHPHLPRTSSPLAHFDSSVDKMHSAAHGPNGDVHHVDRRSSSSFEPRLSRVSSLPPTREVDEEDEEDAVPANRSFSASHPVPPVAHAESKYSPAAPPAARHTPPLPSAHHAPATFSPPKRTVSNYMPHAASAPQLGMAPPARASTQSPTAVHRQYKPAEAVPRPSSSHSSGVPSMTKATPAAHVPARARGQSLTMNMVAPTDGREQDPLGRWKGVPLVAWGVGGTVVTSFPQSVPRYSMNQTAPTIVRTAGEVKVRHIKDIEPLQDRLAKFPGPLRGKSKKKEALAWLAAGIDAQEKELPDISFHAHLSLEAKRGVERLLLWKLLRVFVEHDGALEGTPAVEKAVRDILSPGTATPTADNDALFPTAASLGAQGGPVSSMQADGADPAAMEQIRLNLLKGDRETAVWSAVDKRLWGHAMLISQTVSPDLYKQVAQEFVRKEVNHPGHSNESLGALYKVLSGNYDDCVDELVPSHARAGLQLMTTESTSGPARDAVDGLDKWRETVTLILSNRSTDDVRGLNALGKLLSSYGRAEAAHICFIFSRSLSVFGGLDDANVDFVLLGSDHRQQSDQFAKETEALQLSEVYEYGLSLGHSVAAAAGAPHLAAYKLQYAITLAEYGYRDKALQYCDAIAAAMVSQTKRSPHYHVVLEAAVEDFMTRLKQAPKEMSSSWISKPSMNKVSDSMWNRFNKFVAGDDADGNGNGTGEAENGPFARIASSPNISRSPSVSNFEVYGVASPGYAPNAAPHVPAPLASATTSRYAPAPTQPAGSANPYAPSHYPAGPTSSGRNSNEYSHNPYEPAHPEASASAAPVGNGYAPTGYAPAAPVYQPVSAEPAPVPSVASHEPAAPQQLAPSGYQPYGLQESPSIYPSATSNGEPANPQSQGYQPQTYSYEPPSTAPVADADNHEQAIDSGHGGYEPPSFQPYGYEPPSYQPDAEGEDDTSKPKKKGVMYDDDDIPAVKSQEKSKADKDRENEEMFRKAAEEDAKRAASQQAAKKGWGFSNWFGGSKKEEGNIGEASPGKPIRAKLGEASSFVYDPELKRWINKKSGAENTEAKKATPPPPRAMPRSVSGTPMPTEVTPPPPGGRSSVPPPSGPPRPASSLAPQASTESLTIPPTLNHSVSNPNLGSGPPSAPPSRPTTSMSNASSIDDLLGAAGPRKGGAKKTRKAGRYVDVMAK